MLPGTDLTDVLTEDVHVSKSESSAARSIQILLYQLLKKSRKVRCFSCTKVKSSQRQEANISGFFVIFSELINVLQQNPDVTQPHVSLNQFLFHLCTF